MEDLFCLQWPPLSGYIGALGISPFGCGAPDSRSDLQYAYGLAHGECLTSFPRDFDLIDKTEEGISSIACHPSEGASFGLRCNEYPPGVEKPSGNRSLGLFLLWPPMFEVDARRLQSHGAWQCSLHCSAGLLCYSKSREKSAQVFWLHSMFHFLSPLPILGNWIIITSPPELRDAPMHFASPGISPYMSQQYLKEARYPWIQLNGIRKCSEKRATQATPVFLHDG